MVFLKSRRVPSKFLKKFEFENIVYWGDLKNADEIRIVL